ncbi:MAG: UTP--glucose-1-phosphate uridylyltransferase GalU [Rhodospirillales bacterium]|nr:MAG: UTP--glucose-1-phosphate uridylyltransferase GalU [Rhodospirillales bacterium]
MAKRVRKAVFPVGGLGTRFLPATKAMPKEMLPVVDKPLIQYAVEEAAAAGIEDFIFVTGRAKQAIEDHFDISFELENTLANRGAADLLADVKAVHPEAGRVAYTRQGEPRGLGHAVWCARDLIGDEPFAVVLADDLVLADRPCLRQLLELHESTGGNVVAVTDVPPAHTSRYGILDVESDDGRAVAVKGLVEKPEPERAPSTLAIIGRYVLLPEVFAHLEQMSSGAGGEIQLTDSLAKMVGKAPFHGLRFEGRRFDCGDKLGLFEANIAFALERPDLVDGVRHVLAEYARR